MLENTYVQFVPNMGYFTCRKCTDSWDMPKTTIDFIDLTYLVDGEAEYKIDGVYYKVSAGDLLCIPMGSTREGITSSKKLMTCYSANFLLHDFYGNDAILPYPIVCHIGIKQDIIELYKDLNTVWLERSPGYQIKASGILLLIIHRYLELAVYKTDSEIIDSRIKKTIFYVTNHYNEDLKIDRFADQFNLSPMYFGLLFKRTMGMSFHRYLTEIRLNNAENMLRSGEHTVLETALSCGFKDSFYFSNTFKKNRHISPSKLIDRGKRVRNMDDCIE